MVDYNGLENRRTERYRGFESLSLRQKESNDNVRFLFLVPKNQCIVFYLADLLHFSTIAYLFCCYYNLT